MSVQEVHRLTEERNEAQIALEEACRATFLPGMTIAYGRGGKEVIAVIVAQDEERDHQCIVRNPKTGKESTIWYDRITRIVEGDSRHGTR